MHASLPAKNEADRRGADDPSAPHPSFLNHDHHGLDGRYYN